MSTRVAVVGNCQVWGLAARLSQRRPDWEVRSFFVGNFKTPEEKAAAAEAAKGCDLVFSHPLRKEVYGGLRTDLLREQRQVILTPGVMFSGFHPDAVVVRGPAGPVYSPLGSLNSRIALAGYLLGLSAGRTLQLYNAFIYERLGYFDEYARAETFQLKLGREAEADVGPLLARWRGRLFMHQPLHPRIELLADMADMLLAARGETGEPAEALPPDDLDNEAIWPVYPELARRLNLAGGTSFRAKGGQTFSLADFVEDSHRRYRDLDLEGLADPAVSSAMEIIARELV